MTTQKDTFLDKALDGLGHWLSARLRRTSSGYHPFTPSDYDALCRTLKPGDVLLVEGNERIANAIKYLTQSTWSHAAVFVGDALPEPADGSERPQLVEVNLGEGCVAVPVSKYRCFNTRICRAAGLNDAERAAIVQFMVERIGLRYDMRNIFDLLRYFFPTPPVPVRWRRRMLAFGSGDPTRAICSSLIAQAFQSIRYPILPQIFQVGSEGEFSRREVFHIRHHSLFAPRDFDISPFFEVVKPTLALGFDFREIEWDAPLKRGEDWAQPVEHPFG
ncbi:lipo-like protein [Ruegeria sediminis]|uniref:Lipo-like protein n=1 Tax=Ruegeria sediminis TaxID=2583820 RepID=A0ABY2WZ12_9RHOB|nr:YiiX/YebB-like N1pC/P60 family cysteine hydrolase [Ruegeria sediminis]TMV07823.1 lipo-like protein [Ruegeria sediminis]